MSDPTHGDAKYSEVPHWPTVGTLLRIYFDTAGLGEKDQDFTGTSRKYVRGVADENDERVEFYLAEFQLIADRLENLTEGCSRHWLSGAAFANVVSSYQWFVSTIPCPPVTQQSAVREFVRVFAAFSMEYYFKWLRDDHGRTRLESDDLWFLPGAKDAKNSLPKLMARVCQHLRLETCTAHSLAACLFAGDDFESVNSREKAERTFQNWFNGAVVPHWSRFEALILANIKKLDEAAAKAATQDLLSFFWGCELALLLEKENLTDELQELHSQIWAMSSLMLERPQYSPPLLPSLLAEGSPELVEWERSLFHKYTDPAMARILQGLELPDDLAVLVELADAGWYRFGRVWHQTVTRAFDMARDLDDARQRPLHKQLLVLGNLGTKFKSSENWREIQRNPLPYIVSSDDVTWSRDLGRAHRNELRKVGLYLRTQLQVAVSRRDAEIVGRLLDHGADPAVRVIDGGDNATALLMAFRVLGQDALARRSMVKLILEALDKRSPEVVQASVNARTTTTNSSAFSQAIETGDSWGVVELLNRGADVDCPVGGDEDSPLYLVMNYFLLAFRAEHQPEFFTDLHLASRDSVNLTRLNAPLPGSLLMRIIEAEMPGGSERASRLLAEQLTKQSSREERLALVRTLLSRGADPNRLQRLQKRYPLDFALEIDREAGTDLSSLIRDAGGYRVSLH